MYFFNLKWRGKSQNEIFWKRKHKGKIQELRELACECTTRGYPLLYKQQPQNLKEILPLSWSRHNNNINIKPLSLKLEETKGQARMQMYSDPSLEANTNYPGDSSV